MGLSDDHCIQRKLASLTRLMGVVLLAEISGTANLRAELTWKEKTVEINAEAKADVLEARFRFTNDGATPVDIQDIETSCGCTTAALEQRHYEHGQGGEIVARYTVGDHVGMQKKSIFVMTNDHPEATILTLAARVPELLHLEQTFVAWKHGEAAAAKAIQITTPPNAVMLEDLSVQPSNAAVTAELRPATDRSGYDLRVTPGSTERAAFVTLIIRWHHGTEEKTVRAYATVEQAAAPTVEAEPVATTPAAPSGAKSLPSALPVASPAR